jgi:hypothetical protein
VARARLPLAAAAAGLAAACVLFASVGASASSYGPVAGNPVNRLIAKPLEGYRYDYARRCRRHPMPGALRLERWLDAHFRGVSWGIMRCEKLGRRNYSLHAEGRAIDWHLSVHSAGDRRAAGRLILMLLATDRAGNPHALARRMGVQEIIWNCRSWWSGAERMGRYSYCYDRHGRRRRHLDETQAHRNHVHIGLNLAGARLRTSFWRR